MTRWEGEDGDCVVLDAVTFWKVESVFDYIEDEDDESVFLGVGDQTWTVPRIFVFLTPESCRCTHTTTQGKWHRLCHIKWIYFLDKCDEVDWNYNYINLHY